MKIAHVKITPIAFRDPPLLNAAGIHEPYALRSIIEIESHNGYFGLGESYGDAPVLEMLTSTAALLPGMSVFDTNGLRQRVFATVAKGTREARIHSELPPGTDPLRDVEKIYSAPEVAFLDLQARYLGVPLVELLGGGCGARCRTAPTCSTSMRSTSAIRIRRIAEAKCSMKSSWCVKRGRWSRSTASAASS